jgi:hypothetical protein
MGAGLMRQMTAAVRMAQPSKHALDMPIVMKQMGMAPRAGECPTFPLDMDVFWAQLTAGDLEAWMIFQLRATAHPSSADDSHPREWLKCVQGGMLLTHAQGLRTILMLYTAGTEDEDNSDRVNGVDDSSGRDGVTRCACPLFYPQPSIH